MREVGDLGLFDILSIHLCLEELVSIILQSQLPSGKQDLKQFTSSYCQPVEIQKLSVCLFFSTEDLYTICVLEAVY